MIISNMSSEPKINFVNALSVKVNDYLIIKDRPCKIAEVVTCKTGKHGGCKCHFTGIDIFNGNKHVTMHKSTESVKVPVVTKTDYQLCDINKEETRNNKIVYLCSLMDSEGKIRDDISLDDQDLAERILKEFGHKVINVTVMEALEIE